MEAILGDTFMLNTGEERTINAKIVAVYFGAKWCQPCLNFNTRLVDFYHAVNEDIPSDEEKNVEIVFCSSDQNEEQFHDFMQDMPWCTIPFSEKERMNRIKQQCGVVGIPMVVIIKRNGTILTKGGRADILKEGPNSLKKWLEAP
mmetsp:Transcript_41752/g.48085  ORF Transcript_41752/g.48085 Transcript_41752/m.48085 type:complete len:145 (-) Transcript_41752:255-689(-)